MSPVARLDAELVRRGLARSRGQASEAIADGRVSVDGRPVARASLRVTDEQTIEVAGADHYVARSAHKLLAALDAFAIDPGGRLALDIGASTGGFTQVLLERGAREVVALDVGHGQLVHRLRADPRVRVVEGVNARDLTPSALAAAAGTDETPDLVVADVSFIPLRLVLPALVETVGLGADYLLLIKPQFEVGRTGVREGVVRDRGLRQDAASQVLWAAHDLGLATRGLVSSPVLGSGGNREYLAWLGGGAASDPTQWTGTIADLP